jgi:hypothetical protein
LWLVGKKVTLVLFATNSQPRFADPRRFFPAEKRDE